MHVRDALTALATACLLAACAPTPPPPAPAAATPGAAQLGSRDIGIDLAGIDHGTRPGDDFYRYANGIWQDRAQIPADRSNTGTFFEVYRKAEQRNADLIQHIGDSAPAAGSDARRIADYYAAYMDEGAIERAGLAPLQPALDAIDAIVTREDLARVLGSELRADVDPLNATDLHTNHLFGLFVSKGLAEESTNLPYLFQGGLTMPGREDYLDASERAAALRAKLTAYARELLALAKRGDAATAEAVIALETKIARVQQPVVEIGDMRKANNLWQREEFASQAPGLDWTTFFRAAGLEDATRFQIWQPATIRALAALTASESIENWKAWLAFHALDRNAELLPKAYADLAFGFHSRALQGVEVEQERWKRAVAATSTDLGDAVGKAYVEKHFPAASRARVEKMVAHLIAAFDAGIVELDWMTPETKRQAREKVATLRVGVGYPDTWRDYAGLEIRADDALGNRLRAERFEYEHQKAKIGTLLDRDEWWMTPQTVNAVNLPLQNALNFPAAILEPPFFDANADDAANYGAIGAIIGHEISHSFDNMGAEFDALGRLANWWNAADAEHFKTMGERLVAQYDAYEPLAGVHINGRQTLGENIADVSGLAAALAGYHASLDGAEPITIDGLGADQRFFIAYAQAWRGKIRDAALRQRLATDVHAPGPFRAQTVRNLDAWYPAFGIQPDAALYLAPDARVKIW